MKYIPHYVVFVTLLAALMFRWDIYQTPGEGVGRAFMLDRWTGDVYFMHWAEKTKVVTAKP